MGVYLSPGNRGFRQRNSNISVAAGRDASESPWRLRCLRFITAVVAIPGIYSRDFR